MFCLTAGKYSKSRTSQAALRIYESTLGAAAESKGRWLTRAECRRRDSHVSLGDTSQLDQVFATLPAKTQDAMNSAGVSVRQLGDDFGGVNFELDATASNVPYCGEVIKDVMESSGKVTHEAAAEAGLLGEAFGIHLPRHVRTFLGELPGVSTVLQGAFAATAVLFLIDALVQAIEKITEWSEKGEKIAAAWEKYDQTIFETSTNMQKEIDKQEQKLVEMTQGPVAGLDFALKHLQGTAFETFSLITKDVDIAVKAMNEASSSLLGIQFNVFKDAGKDLEKFRDELQKTMRLATEAHPGDPFVAYNAGVELVKEKERELTKLITDRTAASGRDASAAVDGLHAERQAVNDMLPVLEQGIRLQKDKDDVLKQQKSDLILRDEESILKARVKAEQDAADKIDAAWMKNRDKAIATLQEGEKEKIDATRAGSEARLAAIDAALKEEESKGLQDTAFYRSLQDQKVKFFEAALAAQEKAASQAAAEALKKTESDAKVQTALVAEQYGQQEKAFQLLASFKLISATQASHQLELLYAQESQKLLKILNDQLKKEEDAVKAAQQKLSAAKNNPFMSPQQIEELKKLLLQAEQAEAATQVKIATTTQQFQEKQLALDKGHYGQALAIATAFGNAILAEKLKENHSALLLAQGELAEAKARGVNTDAINKEVKALQHVENELNKEARSLKTTGAAVDKFKEDLKSAAQEEVATFSSAMEAMVTGQETFGQAMEAGTIKVVGSLAQKWGEYYAALAIADLVTPGAQAKGAGELAASIALFALGGALSGFAGNISNSGNKGTAAASTGSTASTGSSAATQPAQQPGGGVANIPRLYDGGIVTTPTYAMIGDRPGGGSRAEAVIPLDDPRARALMESFGGAGGVHYHYTNNIKGFLSTSDLTKLNRINNRSANTGRTRISVSNSARVTRKG
jgi:hypothetical protein